MVLVDKGDDEGYKLYHGTNMEVSMPTGSLCAERNVIGTALAADFGLRRTHLRMIAVLGLNLDEQVESLSRTSESALAPRSPVNNSAARPPDSPSHIRRVRSYPKIDYDADAEARATPASAQTLMVEVLQVRAAERFSENVARSTARDAPYLVPFFQRDMNPMKPCGACREWLKKIAEVNPSFKVLTFTDQGGAGVYMESEF